VPPNQAADKDPSAGYPFGWVPILWMGTPLTRALVAAYVEYALTHLRWVPRPGYPSDKEG